MRGERNGVSGPEHQAVVAYPRHAEGKDVVTVGRTNTVTYAARDKKNGVELVCSAPIGSQHAAKVLELCNHIYSSGTRDSKPVQRQIATQTRHAIQERRTADDEETTDDLDTDDEPEIEERSPRTTSTTIGSYSKSAARTVRHETGHYAVQNPASKQAYEKIRHAPETTLRYGPSAKSGCHPAPSTGGDSDGMDEGSTVTGTESPSRLPATLKSRHQPQQQHQGYRHDSGAQTTYHVHTKTGELFVSAPNGSGEAKLFDDVASRAAGKDYVSAFPSDILHPQKEAARAFTDSI